MADEITIDSFLDLLRQSDLLPETQLRSLAAEIADEGTRPENAKKLADDLVKREILTTWQAEMLLQGKHRGFRLGPYRILRPLGQGGMSKVFLAEHEVMRRCCAIKVLPGKFEEDPDLLSRFHLEARAVAALDHPNIVRAYDFNKDVRSGKQIHYLVMEYVEGQDLRRMVEEHGPLDYRKAADFICQAAEGLAHAHAAGFVHRDIKPANLLVDPHGVLKVLDLGLARFSFEVEQAEQGSNQPESGQSAVGTADYVAPEQVIDSRNVDGRADIYSLGYTFYFLLTGRRPFSKPTIMELLMAHRTEEPEPISKSRPDVPLELESIIAKMTAKSPYQRYQTAKDLAEKLRTWLRESGSSRGYSRISALMAEAMRAKQQQQAGHETARAKSEAAEDKDLELVRLEDEPKSPRDVASAKPAKSGPMAAIKATAADAKDRQTAANVSDEPEPPKIQSDLLSSSLPEESVPTLPLSGGLSATTSSPLQAIARPSSKKKDVDWSAILASPWCWASLIGVVLIVVVSVLWISLTPPAPSRTPEHPVVVQPAAEPSQALPSDAEPTPEIAQPMPETTKPSPETSQPTPSASKETHPLPENQPPSQSLPIKKTFPFPLPDQPPDEPTPEPAPTPPASTLSQSSVTEAEKVKQPEPTQPPTSVQNEIKQPGPAKPSPENGRHVDEMLAGITTIWFHFPSSDSNDFLNAVIKQQATTAAQQAGLDVAEKDAAVMELELKTNKVANLTTLTLSAELKCPGPDGKPVTIWKHSGRLISGDPKKMRPGPVLQKVLVERVVDFFDQFSTDVRKARSKVEQKPLP